MAGVELKFGEGGSDAEMAVRTIEEQLAVLRAAADANLLRCKLRPENLMSPVYKAFGETLNLAADRIKNEVEQLKHDIESIDMSPTGRS